MKPVSAYGEGARRFRELEIPLNELEEQVAFLATRIYPDHAEAAWALTILLCLRQREGAVALPLNESATDSVLADLIKREMMRVKRDIRPDGLASYFPGLDSVTVGDLVAAGMVKSAGNDSGEHQSVFVLDQGWLYLRRFWRYEKDVADMISIRIKSASESTEDSVDTSARSHSRPTGFPAATDPPTYSRPTGSPAEADPPTHSRPTGNPAATDPPTHTGPEFSSDPDQNRAVAAGLDHRFLVITGGPGTGKTYTVLLMLAAMYEKQPGLRTVLCAPTGKAAARMMESVSGNIERINLPDDRKKLLPDKATTIHRMIRWNPTTGRPGFGPDHPLPYDVVILDEASMVDMALMSRLARALRPETRLVMLGDKDQLASVEAGAVFADIADAANMPNHPLHSMVIRLATSWRFEEHSEIGRLASLLNRGEVDASWKLLSEGKKVRCRTPKGKGPLYASLLEKVKETHQQILRETDHERAYALLSDSQILTALRIGPGGSEQINRYMDNELGGNAPWYDGRPVIVTSNNYDLNVYNGDIGLTRRVDDTLRVAFPSDEPGKLRWIAPARLKSVVSAWALTVHKSQGSEYRHVILVLPDHPSGVLTRELGYTALTRASESFEVWGNREVWKHLLTRRTERSSGLAERLRRL